MQCVVFQRDVRDKSPSKCGGKYLAKYRSKCLSKGAGK